jgi:head-tail adaptor
MFDPYIARIVAEREQELLRESVEQWNRESLLRITGRLVNEINAESRPDGGYADDRTDPADDARPEG